MTTARALTSMESLPPIPEVGLEVLRQLNAPEVDLSGLSAALAREPGLTGRIVGAANTAFFAGQRPIYTAEDAVVRLGLNRIRIIAVSVLLGTRLRSERCPGFEARRFWADSLRSASAATRLGAVVPLETPRSAAYICGLLRNIGVLAHAYLFPGEMSRTFAGARQHPDTRLSVMEMAELGFDHHFTGAEVLSRWGLPEPVVTAVRNAAVSSYQGPYMRLVALTQMAWSWSQGGFQPLAAQGLLRGVSAARLASLQRECLRESEQMECFAEMLAVA